MMTLNEVENRVKEILIEDMELNLEPSDIDVNEEYFLDKYGLNSVDALELLLRMEEEFDIEISDENLNAELIKSVGVLSNYIFGLLNN